MSLPDRSHRTYALSLLERARDLGLSFNGGSELIGTRGGALVRVTFSGTDAVRLQVEVPARGFPEGLTAETLPWTLRTGELGRLVREGVELDRCWLVWNGPTPGVPLTLSLDRAVAAASELATWWRRPVQALAEAYGLQTDPTLSELSGSVEGMPIQLVEALDEVRQRRALVKVGLQAGMPGVRLRKPSGMHPPTALPDVVLDKRVSVSGPVPVDRLCCDAVRGPLLAVLYDHSGLVDETWVQAGVPSLRALDRVRAALRDALDLAKALTGQ